MTQRDKIKLLFEQSPDRWIPLPEILNLHVAQYNARIKELRDSGMEIINKWQIVDGVKHSWFMWVKPKKFVEDNIGQFSFI